MGLSGRKVKQRIGKDPRNLSWADDANRFGQAYLAKFGWDASKGLGVSGDGRMSAIKATQKLDMLGIGMQHQKDPNGIAWRQNRDFENLLRRLNEGTDDVTGPFHKAREESLKGWGEGGEEQTSTSETGNLQDVDEDERDGDEDEGEVVIAKKEKKKKKKKRKTAEALEEDEDPPDKKKRKKRKGVKGDDEHHALAKSEPPLAPCCPPPPPESPTMRKEEPGFASTAAVTAPVSIRAPPRTHRARIIAAKRMAASNSTALAEILGIPSTSSTSSLSSPYPSTAITPTHTPTPVPTAEEQEPLTKLTTSSQSVGDYFKAKLSAKAHGERQPRLTVATGDNASTPTWDSDDHDHRPGLGLDKGASRMLATDESNEEQARGGIGATKSSKFAAMFTTQSRPAADSRGDNAAAAIELVEAHDATDQDDDWRKREKRRAREERRREKEERRRRRAEAGRLDDAVVDVPVGEASASAGRTKKKKRHGLGAPDGDTQLPGAGGTEVIRTQKRKCSKDKKIG